MIDALRLSFGTFTGIKVKAPTKVDTHQMKLALLLSFLPTLMVSGVAWTVGYLAYRYTEVALVAAVMVVGVEAFLTAGLHIDGLLDTADGEAVFAKSGRERALEVMRMGNSGPAAFATGFLVLLLQVASLSAAITKEVSVFWIIAGLLARLAVVISCRVGAKSARSDGLGNPFIGSIDYLWLCLAVAVNFGLIMILGAGMPPLLTIGSCVASLIFAEFLKRSADKKFGGLTGDILGSILEKCRALSLVLLNTRF